MVKHIILWQLKDEYASEEKAVILMNRKPESGKDTKVLIQKNWK